MKAQLSNTLLFTSLFKVSQRRQQLIFIGRTGRTYTSAAQSDVKVVSSVSAGSQQHAPPSLPPPQPAGFVFMVLSYQHVVALSVSFLCDSVFCFAKSIHKLVLVTYSGFCDFLSKWKKSMLDHNVEC